MGLSIWAVMMVKDEADIIGYTIDHLFRQGVTGIVIGDNLSSDGTRDILEAKAHQHNLVIFNDSEVGYYQSRKMTRLAKAAAEYGAEWILPCDADEFWWSNVGLTVVEEILRQPNTVLSIPMWNHFCTGRDEVSFANPTKRMAWSRVERNPMNKVCFEYNPDYVITQGNHGIVYGNVDVYPPPVLPSVISESIEIHHYPYRSEEQFIRKVRNGAAAYAATSLPISEGAHWRQYGDILATQGEEGIRQVFRQHFYFDNPEESGLVQVETSEEESNGERTDTASGRPGE